MNQNTLKHLFSRQSVCTLPNLLSLFRLLMIPWILWLYTKKAEYRLAALMIVVSGITDIADGFIARKFHMVSDLGKILDPAADKLTQLAIIVCLTSQYHRMRILAGLFVLREITMILLGLHTIKQTDTINSSKWYGKAATVCIYITMMLLILIPDIPMRAADLLIGACIAMILFSLLMYLRFYQKYLKQNRRRTNYEKA